MWPSCLRQPLILGYVLGGFLIGPFTPGPTLSEVHQFEVLAEIGVILLMYSIGLEFSFSELLQVKWVAIFGAPLGILLSVGMGVGAGWLMGWNLTQGIAVGAIVSVASTMVLSRLLADRGELRSPHGHVMIGITLVEDLAVVVLTVLLPSLTNLTGSHFLSLGNCRGQGPADYYAGHVRGGEAGAAVDEAGGSGGNEELYVLVVLALGFATAAVTQAVGLSLALGAFLAGLIVSESGTTHKMLDKLSPLRDAFVALFFVTIGALVDPRILISKPSLWGAIVIHDHAWEVCHLDRCRLAVSLSSANRAPGRPGTHPDRRIFLRPGAGGPRCPAGHRGYVPRHSGGFRDHDPVEWPVNEGVAPGSRVPAA